MTAQLTILDIVKGKILNGQVQNRLNEGNEMVINKIKYILTLSVALVANSYCMDVNQPVNRMRKSRATSARAKEYVDVDLTEIGDHVGANGLRFYTEYRPKIEDKDTILFPLRSCDPVPIHTFGDIRYFYTSAIPGKFAQHGAPYQVENFTNIIAVRGKNDANGNRFEAYLGINKNEFEKKGKNKIYIAHLLVMQVKSTKHVDEHRHYAFDTKHLSSNQLGLEIRKRLENQEAVAWGNSQYQKVFHELIGEGWVPCRILIGGSIRKDVFTRDDEVIGNGAFHSNKVYWTKDENKLKGITYGK